MAEPLSMREGAIGVHEMYLAYINAGFSAEQAFELTKIMVKGINNV